MSESVKSENGADEKGVIFVDIDHTLLMDRVHNIYLKRLVFKIFKNPGILLALLKVTPHLSLGAIAAIFDVFGMKGLVKKILHFGVSGIHSLEPLARDDASSVVDECFESLNTKLLEEVQKHAEETDKDLYLLSATFQEVVDLFQTKLVKKNKRWKGGVGSKFFADPPVINYGDEKVDSAEELCRRLTDESGDGTVYAIKACSFYSDSPSDVPLLNRVETRVFVLREGHTRIPEDLDSPYYLFQNNEIKGPVDEV